MRYDYRHDVRLLVIMLLLFVGVTPFPSSLRVTRRSMLLGRGKISGVLGESILERIDNEAVNDYEKGFTEDMHPPSLEDPTVGYEWIFVGEDMYELAIRTTVPVLSQDEVSCIQKSADAHWISTQGSDSRFTYQRKGNYEAHASDLGCRVKEILDRSLRERLYPLVRAAFRDLTENATLCVYDALVIRYDSTETGSVGAGQPLHRDLGLVSINIPLNQGFVGGGTFFENQLRVNETVPLLAQGPGYAVAHSSSERHAGSKTYSGVRDILVLFITSRASTKSTRSARLKQCREFCSKLPQEDIDLCRLSHQKLATELSPSDGEAWQYLGMVHFDMGNLREASHCLRKAASLTPCDARVWNNLGLCYGRMKEERMAETAYAEAYRLVEMSARAGCDVVMDTERVCLNYGLLLANQDRFEDAASVLDRGASAGTSSDRPMLSDLVKLRDYCLRRISA